jgi:hypothetical protein
MNLYNNYQSIINGSHMLHVWNIYKNHPNVGKYCIHGAYGVLADATNHQVGKTGDITTKGSGSFGLRNFRDKFRPGPSLISPASGSLRLCELKHLTMLCG